MNKDLLEKLNKIDNWGNNTITIKVNKDLLSKRSQQVKDSIDGKIPLNLNYLLEQDYCNFEINELKKEIKEILIQSLNIDSEETQKLNKIYETMIKFKQSGYNPFVCHEWHAEFVDKEGYAQQLSTLSETLINELIDCYSEKAKTKAINREKREKECKSEARSMLADLSNE